jgi:protein-disulfide isomerase-like protein with CxxC motif
LNEPELRQRTQADFTMAGRLGAEGFPTVILRQRDRLGVLTVGYNTVEQLLPAAERFFA